MMRPEDQGTLLNPKRFLRAFAPFPRSTWIHPHVPTDNFDRVCRNIWRRREEADKEFGTCSVLPERREMKKGLSSPDSKLSHRTKEQQKETNDLGLTTEHKKDKQQYHTDFILPCPYLSGRRHPHVAKPTWVLNPVMEAEMKCNDGEAKGTRILQNDVQDKQRTVENSQKKIWVGQSSNGAVKQSSAHQPRPLTQNPVYTPHSDDRITYLQEKKDPPLPSRLLRDTCESEDEQDTRSSSDSSSSDDHNVVTLPGLRTFATDSSDGDSVSDNRECEEEKNEIPLSAELSSNSEQDSPSSSTEKDIPPISTIKSGILPCPTEPPASGKVHGQREIPLSFHPHDIPTATLASGVTAHVQAPVQGKAATPQENSKTSETAAASLQQGAYDLLADFPALQPPKKSLALGVLHDGKPKPKDAKGKRGLTLSPNHCQESRASHQRRMEYVPHEVSSICAKDQNPVLDLQTFGSTCQSNSPTISSGQPKANNQLPPRAAGTDGVGVNARSWASAAKAGMKQADAPQEKARPCTFQQIVNINRAKAGYSAAHNFANKGTPYHQAFRHLAPMYHGPRPRNPNQFISPGYPYTHQFGARTHRANCPPGFRCPRFPFQQARGNPSKYSHM
uniref:uncharacterized protein LOC124074560 isoform X2 n=1 Tax=Scatophagus argus TaxID=75038 RepID=UPI001ED83F02|nr:uncharacterized protein LOC124074560 isoform X2 [Scatophagus argus]